MTYVKRIKFEAIKLAHLSHYLHFAEQNIYNHVSQYK